MLEQCAKEQRSQALSRKKTESQQRYSGGSGYGGQLGRLRLQRVMQHIEAKTGGKQKGRGAFHSRPQYQQSATCGTHQ